MNLQNFVAAEAKENYFFHICKNLHLQFRNSGLWFILSCALVFIWFLLVMLYFCRFLYFYYDIVFFILYIYTHLFQPLLHIYNVDIFSMVTRPNPQFCSFVHIHWPKDQFSATLNKFSWERSGCLAYFNWSENTCILKYRAIWYWFTCVVLMAFDYISS